MTRQRLRLVGGATDGSGVDEGPPQEAATSDGFALRFAGGRGVLQLAGKVVSPAVKIDLLEITIPKISFPFDFTSGIGGLRDRRLILSRLILSVGLDGLEEMIRARLAASNWITNPRFGFENNCISVLLEYGPAESRVPFSFRLLPSAGKRSPSLLIDEARAYGPMPAPLLLVPAAVVREVTGTRLDGIELYPPDPVKAALMAIMPGRGWRIPDHSGIRLAELELLADRAVLDYRAQELIDGEAQSTASGVGLERLRKLEESRLVRAGDRALDAGDTAGARSVYSRLLDQEPDNPLVAARLAMLDMVDNEIRDTARALVTTAVERNPDRTDLRAVLAHGAALAGDEAAEAEALEALFESGLSLERLATGLRLGTLLTDRDPERAASWLERAIKARREDPQAIMALMQIHAAAGRAPEVGRLIPRWIAVHKSPNLRAKAHYEAGMLLLAALDDPPGAVRHFERAALAAPDNMQAAWGLADALSGAGEAERAISQYERLERRCGESGDSAGAARAMESIGRVWMSKHEPDLAAPRFREALAAEPPTAWRHARLAGALAALGRHADAANELENALKRSRPDDLGFPWSEKALDLAEIYLDHLEDQESADPWVRAVIDRPEVEDRARGMLVRLLENRGNWSELTARLERTLTDEPSADNAIALARARVKAGEYGTALSTLESAAKRFPKRSDLLDVLIEASRGAGERSRLRKALIERLNTVDDSGRRASISAEIGTLELTAFENPGAAIGWFRRAIESVPGLVEAHQGLADALRRLGRGEELDQQLEELAASFRAAGRSADAAQAMAERSRLLVAAGKTNRAASLLREALPELPEASRPAALLEMASLFLASDNPSAARDLFAAARKSPGTEGEYAAALGEAEAALRLGDHDGALVAATIAGSGPVELRARAAMTAAKAALFLGRAAEAAGTLERVAENTEPEEGLELMMFAARIQQSELGDAARARDLFERVLELDPLHVQARQNLVELLESSGDRVELAEGLMRLVDDSEEGIADLKRAADFFSAEGLPERAVEALRRALGIQPDPETTLMLAQALKRSGEPAEMLELLRRTAPDNDDARDRLANELEEAAAYDELAELLASFDVEDSAAEIDRLLRLARIHRDSRNDDQAALACLQKAREIGGDDERVLESLESQLTKLQRWSDLLELLGMRIAHADADKAAELQIQVADLLAGPMADRRAAADSLLSAVLAASDRWSGELARRALALAEGTDDSRLVIRCLEECTRTADPGESTNWQIRLASAYDDAGDEAGSLSALESALEQDPKNVEVITSLAKRAAADKSWERVVELTSSIPPQERQVGHEKLRAHSLQRAGRTEEAVKAWGDLAAREPADVRSLDELASLLEESGRLSDLAAVLERRIKLAANDDERAELLTRRAKALSRGAGDPAAGLEDIVAAARLRPADGKLVNAAAEAAAKAGRWHVAEEMLSASISAADGPDRGTMLRRRAAIRRTRLSDARGAADDMLAAREIGPLSEPEAEVLVDLLEDLGDQSSAFTVAASLAMESADDDGLRLARAAQLATVGDKPSDARDLWRRAIAMNSDPAWTVSLLKLLDTSADADEMLRLLDELADKEHLLDIPDHLSLLEARVELELDRGHDLEAVDGLAAMMDLAPASHDPWQRMISILERRGEWESLADRMRQRLNMANTPKDVAKTAFALGRLLEEKLGDEHGAVEAFEQATAAVPAHQGANMAQAGLAYRRQQWDDLERYLSKLEPQTTTPEIELWRARSAEHSGRADEALQGLRKIVDERPTELAAVEALFRLVAGEEHDVEVLALGARLIDELGADELRASIHRRLGLAQLRQGNLEAAREALERADRISDGDPDSLLLLADLHRRQERYREQVEALSRLGLLVSGPERTRHMATAGRICLDRLGDASRARHWFNRAAETGPDDTTVLLGLADSAWATDDRATVVHALERLRLVKPEFPLGASRLYHLAAAAAETGEWPAVDVIETLEHALPSLSGEERDSAEQLASALRGKIGDV
ncbi:MAG: tetratricopeptide repeat protein [Deltaproteobacteria bacterium]|nr:tetratricopeptide repeat protein [Deltaproteobacteria bacterium]